MERSRQTRPEERLAQRRRDRVTHFGPGARRRLDAGVPVLYDVDGEPVKEDLDEFLGSAVAAVLAISIAVVLAAAVFE